MQQILHLKVVVGAATYGTRAQNSLFSQLTVIVETANTHPVEVSQR